MKRGLQILMLLMFLCLLTLNMTSREMNVTFGQTTTQTTTTGTDQTNSTDYATSSTTVYDDLIPGDSTWSDDLNVGDSFEWSVDIFKINGSTVTNPDNEPPIKEGSSIKIDIKKDPHGVIYSYDTISQLVELFDFHIDGVLSQEEIGNGAIELFLVPIYVKTVTGYENYFENADEFLGMQVDVADGKVTIKDNSSYYYPEDDYAFEMVIDYDTGVLLHLYNKYSSEFFSQEMEFNLVSDNIEGAKLPIKTIWITLPMLSIPIIRRKFNNTS